MRWLYYRGDGKLRFYCSSNSVHKSAAIHVPLPALIGREGSTGRTGRTGATGRVGGTGQTGRAGRDGTDGRDGSTGREEPLTYVGCVGTVDRTLNSCLGS